MTNPYDPDPRDGLSQIPPARSQFRNTHQLRLPAQRTSWKLFGFSELLLMVRTMTMVCTMTFLPPWLMFLSSPHGVNVYVTQFMNDNGSASEQL